MRKIDMIVVHCSGSRCNHPYTVEQLRHDHVEVNGWFDSAIIIILRARARYMSAVR